MKRICLIACLLVSVGCFADQVQVMAKDWAAGSKELAALDHQKIAAIFAEGQKSFDNLTAQIKKNGVWDPLSMTTMAALTQYAAQSEVARATHAARLLAAAKAEKEADRICFFLNQLRLCGLPSQVPDLEPFLKSKKPGVADFAEMVSQSLRDTYPGFTLKQPESRAEAFQRELKTLTPDTMHPRLIKFIKDRDPGCVTIALRKGAFGGGEEATMLWCKAFQTERSTDLKIRIAELLAERNDSTAVSVLTEALADSEQRVVQAAAQALLALDRQAFIVALPDWMARAKKRDLATLNLILGQMATHELSTTLAASYEKASASGRVAALNFFQKRKVATSMEIAFSAIDDKRSSVYVAGYRLLREIAGKDQAARLVEKALLTKGWGTLEAENAIASAASRDASGSYPAVLLAAVQRAKKPGKIIALELSSRLGGDALLKFAREQAMADDEDISAEAIRALSRWNGTQVIPFLMRLAVEGKTKRVRGLALHGLGRKVDHVDKIVPYYSLYEQLSQVKGRDSEKNSIAKLFTKPINVAKGKPVTANVATEQQTNPLTGVTDGTLALQWWGAAYPAQLEVDLQKVFPLSSMLVNFFYGDGRVYTFNMEVSRDRKNWTKVCGNEADPRPADEKGVHCLFEEIPARYVRLNILKNSANQAVHVLELQVFSSIKVK